MQTVIVTGAAKGIGKQIAIDFAKEGYNVCINYNTSQFEAIALQTELINLGYSVCIYKADISNRQEVDDMVKFVISKYGKVDVLVNNAGICNYSLFTDVELSQFQKMIDVNLIGMFNCTQSVLKSSMIPNHSGKIINISSIWGITGAACEVTYSTVKAGIIGFTKALAKELSLSGITVNAVAPGVIETDMINNLSLEEKEQLKEEIPMSRIGTAKDVSGVVKFLANDDANYITGQVISPNGGMVI